MRRQNRGVVMWVVDGIERGLGVYGLKEHVRKICEKQLWDIRPKLRPTLPINEEAWCSFTDSLSTSFGISLSEVEQRPHQRSMRTSSTLREPRDRDGPCSRLACWMQSMSCRLDMAPVGFPSRCAHCSIGETSGRPVSNHLREQEDAGPGRLSWAEQLLAAVRSMLLSG